MQYDSDRIKGDKYEQFIAAYYSSTLGCRIIYQGHILGKADGGIDLIAVSPDTTYLIQCKNWSNSAQLHEDVVNQLSGAAVTFARKYPSARNIKPVLVAACSFAEDAIFAAEANKVELRNLYFREKYVNGQLILSNGNIMTSFYPENLRPPYMQPQNISDYQKRVSDLIDEVQHPVAVTVSKNVTDKAVIAAQKTATAEEISEDLRQKYAVFPSKTDRNDATYSVPDPIPPEVVAEGCLGCFGYIGKVLFVIALCAALIFSAVAVGRTLLFEISPTPTPTSTPSPRPTAIPTASPEVADRPENGSYYSYALQYISPSSRSSSLTITTPNGYDYCIILVSADDPSRRICSVYMRAGQTSTIRVPAERVLIYDTSAPVGSAWYGNNRYFGSVGTWSTSDEIFDFKRYSWTLTMEKVTDGNWDTEQVDDKDVPFLN